MRQLKITKIISNRDPESLDTYLDRIKSDEVLTIDEEIELAKLIKKGDRQALKILVRPNLWFVYSIAKEYLNQGLRFQDLYNEGYLALIRAAEYWDGTQGEGNLMSYATEWIHKGIQQAIVEQERIVRYQKNEIKNE